MKLPLLNILRTSKVFAIVLGLHLFILSLLLFHPGCQTTKNEPAAAPMSEVTALDNATLAEPTRPEGTETVAMNDVPAVSDAQGSVITQEPIPAPVETHSSYTVQKGDSLWGIARKHGTTVGALAEANQLSRSAVLKVGQVLQVPAATQAPATSAAAHTTAETAPVAAGSTYVVKAGDSLSKIAKRTGTTVRALKNANQLHSDTIRVGQKLKVPGTTSAAEAPSVTETAPSTAPVVETSPAPLGEIQTSEVSGQATVENLTTHKVEAGESPAVIAKKYGMKTSELIAINNITDPRKLKIGQELKVKAPAAAATESAPVAIEGSASTAAMSVEALEAATGSATNSEATAPVVEVQPEAAAPAATPAN